MCFMSNYQCTLIQYPSGRWGFVGTIDYRLGWIRKDGSMPTAAEVETDLMLPASYRRLKSRSFETQDEGITFYKALKP